MLLIYPRLPTTLFRVHLHLIQHLDLLVDQPIFWSQLPSKYLDTSHSRIMLAEYKYRVQYNEAESKMKINPQGSKIYYFANARLTC